MRLTASAIALSFAILAACGPASEAASSDDPAPAAEANDAEIRMAQNEEAPAPEDAAPPAVDLSQVDPDAAVLGDADAPIEIVEYASVTCPHCAAFHADLFPHVKSEWIDTGKAKLVMRPLPTPPVELAMAGFLLARCSGPDQYFTVLEDLFETQEELFASTSQGDLLAYYEGLAAANGVDPDGLDACFADQDGIDQINAAIMAADADNVSGTPSFMINGQPADRMLIQTEEGWDTALQAALDGEAAAQ